MQAYTMLKPPRVSQYPYHGTSTRNTHVSSPRCWVERRSGNERDDAGIWFVRARALNEGARRDDVHADWKFAHDDLGDAMAKDEVRFYDARGRVGPGRRECRLHLKAEERGHPRGAVSRLHG